MNRRCRDDHVRVADPCPRCRPRGCSARKQACTAATEASLAPAVVISVQHASIHGHPQRALSGPSPPAGRTALRPRAFAIVRMRVGGRQPALGWGWHTPGRSIRRGKGIERHRHSTPMVASADPPAGKSSPQATVGAPSAPLSRCWRSCPVRACWNTELHLECNPCMTAWHDAGRHPTGLFEQSYLGDDPLGRLRHPVAPEGLRPVTAPQRFRVLSTLAA